VFYLKEASPSDPSCLKTALRTTPLPNPQYTTGCLRCLKNSKQISIYRSKLRYLERSNIGELVLGKTCTHAPPNFSQNRGGYGECLDTQQVSVVHCLMHVIAIAKFVNTVHVYRMRQKKVDPSFFCRFLSNRLGFWYEIFQLYLQKPSTSKCEV